MTPTLQNETVRQRIRRDIDDRINGSGLALSSLVLVAQVEKEIEKRANK